MLKTNRSTTLNGQSVIKDVNGTEQQVVSMSAIVAENGGIPNKSVDIQNRELYLANKSDCRKDMADFDDIIDGLLGGTTNAN